MASAKPTELDRSERVDIGEERSMDRGACSRLDDKGLMFSSSAMLGRRCVFDIALACGEVRLLPLPPLNGKRMGDLAGL